MKINIKRYKQEENLINSVQEFHVKQNDTALNILNEIKENQDSSLAYRCGCKSGVCGSCAIKVNGQERLACKTILNENDLIEPLNNTKVIKDLVVDLSYEEKVLKDSQSFLHEQSNLAITKKDEKHIDRQSNCILCQSCYSSCPVYEVNKNFLGPYALTRALRYVEDKKEAQGIQILNSIQNDGIWDCTLCGNCTMVCPQFIDPKTDIMNLRMKSVQNGFEDKSMMAYNSGFDTGFNSDFNSGFDNNFDGGFDPNSGFNPNGF